MCIIVHKNGGIQLKKQVYATCFENNSDGAGFIVRNKDDSFVLQKGLFTFDDFWHAFKDHSSKEALVHFRIKTHGEIDADNTHPFWVVENEMAFAHNGVINAVDTHTEKTKSDTWHFNEQIVKPLVSKYGTEIISEPAIQQLMMDFIGNYSKLVFMQKRGKPTWIFNKHLGDTEGGVWYSNKTYKTYNRPKTPTHVHTPLTPAPYTYPTSNTNTTPTKPWELQVGDICTLAYSIINVGKKDEYCRVTSFGEGRTVNIEIYSESNGYKVSDTSVGAFALNKVRFNDNFSTNEAPEDFPA